MANAARFDNTSDVLSITGPTATAYTFAAWIYIDVDQNDYSTFYGTSASGGGDPFSIVVTDADGTTLIAGSQGEPVMTGPNMTVGAWYYSALTRSAGGTGTLYWAAAGAGSLSSSTAAMDAITGEVFRIGTDVFVEPLNGRVAFCRVWTADLSSSELFAEMASASAVRTSGLWADWPLQADFNDTSGAARHLTQGGAVTFVSGPTLGGGAVFAADQPLLVGQSAAIIRAHNW